MNKKTQAQLYSGRPFFLRNEIDRLLTLSILFSCVLVMARIVHTGRLTFVSLVWNLFLAYVPYFITQALSNKPNAGTRKITFGFLFLLWILFIPNSFYIITDLFHLSDRWNDYIVPQWFDLVLILSFAWNGLLLGVLSVRQMEKIIQGFLPRHHELFYLYPVMCVNALGIYVGRYLRFNSWDLLISPFQLIHDIADIIVHPLIYRLAWSMIFCFSILLTLMYLTIRKISQTLH